MQILPQSKQNLPQFYAGELSAWKFQHYRRLHVKTAAIRQIVVARGRLEQQTRIAGGQLGGVGQNLTERTGARQALHQTEHVAGDGIEFDAAGAERQLRGDVGDHGRQHLLAGLDGAVVAIIALVEAGHHVGVVIRLAAQHHAVDVLQVQVDLGLGLDAAVDDDFEVRKVALELVGVVVLERRHFAVFLGRQAFQDGVAGVHDERRATGRGDAADEVAHEVVAGDVVDADAVLDGDVDGDGVAHGLDAVGHQLRLGHQAGAERALLHALGRAAAVQVDLVVAPLLAQPGGDGQVGRIAAAQLQGHRMLFVVEAQVALDVAVDQRAGGHHLRVQPGVARDLAVEQTAVAVGPVHHRGDGQAAARPHGGRGGVGGRLVDDGHVGNLRGTDGAVIIHGRRGRRPVRRWPAARRAANDKPAAPHAIKPCKCSGFLRAARAARQTTSRLRVARCFFTLVLFQEALAQTDRFRRDFDQFVVGDEFDGVFQRHLNRRHQAHRFIGTRRTHVGQLLALDRVDDQVVVARVDADDHAFVHWIVVDHEHAAAILQFPDGVGDGGAVILRDQHAVAAAGHFTLAVVDWRVLVEHVRHQAGTAGQGHEFALEADQAARRDLVFQTHTALAVRFHVLQVAATTAQLFHDAALVGFFNVHRQLLERLVAHAIDHFEHHARTRHGQLETFATHVFDQNRQVQLAAAGHFEDGVVVGRCHAQRDVGFQFAVQTVAQLARGDELAFAAGQWRVVDHEVHGQGRLVDGQHFQRVRSVRLANGRTDADLVDTVDQHDVAGDGFIDDHAFQALEVQHLVDAALDRGRIRTVQDDDVLARFDTAARDTANADLADVGRVVQRGDLHLQRTVRIVVTRWHVLEDGFEQRGHVAFTHFRVQRSVAVQRRSVDDREVQLLVGGAQLVEQFEGLVDGPLGARARTIDLVDDDDRLQAQRQRFTRDETGLWHRAFLGIDQQQHRVDHRQHALDFTAEVGVARGVDDVDVGAVVLNRAVLRQNGNAAFFFEVVRIHHAGFNLLVLAEGTGLAQQFVDQGGFTVVNVGDDGDVANCAFCSRHGRYIC